jgi:hypothetical protein
MVKSRVASVLSESEASMGSNDNNEGANQGFDGLSSMVSDVDSAVESARKRSQTASPPAQTSAPTSNRSSSDTIYQPPARPAGGAPVLKWVLIIGGVLFLGAIIMSGSGKKKTTASASSGGYSNPTPSGYANTYSQAERFTEQMPSVGTNNVLNSAEIRYCIAEGIRIEGAEGVVNNYDQGSVDRFNRMVNSYNSRCGEYKYRRGALESARSDVEPYRSTLLGEGRRRM